MLAVIIVSDYLFFLNIFYPLMTTHQINLQLKADMEYLTAFKKEDKICESSKILLSVQFLSKTWF